MGKKKNAADALMGQLKKTVTKEKKEPVSVPKKKTPSEARKTSASPPKRKNPSKALKGPQKSSVAQKVTNQNVSLYPINQDQIFELQTLIRNQVGAKCSDSLAIRIALDLCPIDNPGKILEAFSRLQKADGRFRKQ